MKNSKKIDHNFNFLRPIKFQKLIRLGSKSDGGYVVPEILLTKTDCLVSFGYGYDSAFEHDFINLTKKKVFIFDYLCSTLHACKLFFTCLRRFILFRKKFKNLAYHFNTLKNHLVFISKNMIAFKKKMIVARAQINQNKKVFNYSLKEFLTIKNEISVDEIFNNVPFKKIILKCDIEGTEYSIIDDILKFQNKIDIFIIEFHWVDKNIEKFTSSVKKILRYFSIIHIHGNNHNNMIKDINIPEVPEITFVNNKHINEKKFISKFPIVNLDYPNDPTSKDLFFHFN